MSGGLEPRASMGVEAAEKPGVPGCAGFSESPSVNQLGPRSCSRRMGRQGRREGEWVRGSHTDLLCCVILP